MKTLQTLFLTLAITLLPALHATAETPNPGFKSLFIGHSFLRPFAEAMPDYTAAAGIAGHSQSIVFSGGATGAPQALWENASKRNEIQAILDGGDIELFGMTYHPDYPSTTGYENWISYALAKNPTTRIFIALPWLNYPENFNAATYANLWLGYYANDWLDFIDSIRALYPGVDIYSIPYGQSALELRNLFAANNLPGINNLKGDPADSIFTDNLGHAGDILKDLGRLVWLNAIYDVDLSTYSYGPTWTGTNLNAVAESIMAGHNTDYNAAYLTDTDGDRIGDAVDNCISVANPDQAPSSVNPSCGAACESGGCGGLTCVNH